MDIEYKTIQAQTPLFADSKKMQAVLQEEAKAGWQLLWKEDNYKMKLQREISHRDNDKNLPSISQLKNRSHLNRSLYVTTTTRALYRVIVLAAVGFG